MKNFITMISLVLLSTYLFSQVTITQWTFDGTTEPSAGSGVAALIGGTTQHSATTSNGWRITDFPDQSENSGTAGASFMVSTVGYENIVLNFQQQASNTMSRWAEIQYTLDGENWDVLQNNNAGLAPGGENYPFEFDFSAIAEANDNSLFGVRIVSIFSPVEFNPEQPDVTYSANTAYHRARDDDGGSEYSGGGNWRFLNVTFSGDLLAQPTSFYYKGTDALNELTSWGAEADGTGTNPSDFTSANQKFIVANTATVTLSESWTVSGENALVIVGDGDSETELIADAAFTATVSVENNGKLVMQHTDQPTLGELKTGSAVVYSNDAVNIQYNDYFNLTIDDIDPVFIGNGTISIAGNLTLSGNFVMPDAREAAEYNVIFNGSGDQHVNTGSNVLRSYEMTFEKTTGAITFEEGSTIASDNQMIFDIATGASFADNGITIYAGNSVNIAGDGDSYSFTGTLILAGEEEGIVKGSGVGNNFNLRERTNVNDNIVAELNNLVIRVANSGGEFRIRSGSTNELVINGNFIVEAGADGRIRLYNNTLVVLGDILIEEGFSGTIDDINIIALEGSDQKIESAIDLNVGDLIVNDGLTLDAKLTIEEYLEFDGGIEVSENALLILHEGATINGHNENNFISGTMAYLSDNLELTDLFYPLGINGAFLPVTLQVQHNTDVEEKELHSLYISTTDPELPFPFDIEQVYTDYFFELDLGANVETAHIKLPYDTEDAELDPDLLRIVRSDSGEWFSLGGTIVNGSVKTVEPFTQGGTFALAEQKVGTTNAITYFAFEDLDPTAEGIIDGLSITVNVPFGTERNGLVPTIIHNGVSIDPESGVAQDFTVAVTYTVTAENDDEATYTVTVNELPDTQPHQLAVADINGGVDVIQGQSFSVTVELQNETGDVVAALSAIEIGLSLVDGGTGNLAGTTTLTLEEGESSVEFTGLTYDVAESVQIRASATGLEDGVSESFDVLAPVYALHVWTSPPGGGTISGNEQGESAENESVTLTAEASDGFVFEKWTDAEGAELSQDNPYTFAMPGEEKSIVAVFVLQLSSDLLHYWHFNDLDLGENDPQEVEADFSVNGLSARITYPGEGAGYMDDRTHRAQDPVSNLNLQSGQEPDQGAVLRVRNPANTRELIIEAPSTGFEDLYFTFATTRTSNGAAQQELYYSVNGGDDWIQLGDAYDVTELNTDAYNNGWMLKNADLTAIEEVQNNPDLQFRILFVGEGADNTGGNHRFDNITLTGAQITGDVATQLAITSINAGNPVVAGEEFSIQVQARDENGDPAAVETATDVTVSLASGNGTLSGNLTGTIDAGSTSVTITGITYDVAEDISLTASADGLEDATSEIFAVVNPTFTLTLQVSPSGAGTITGTEAGDYQEGTAISLTAEPIDGFAFANWTDGQGVVSTESTYSFSMPAENIALTANFEEEYTGGLMLVHYWHFNTLSGTVTEVSSDYSAGGLSASITYPGTGDGYMDARTHRPADPVSNFNLRMGQEPNQGAVLRVRNPANTRELLFEAPSTGFSNLVITWAATRTENGGTHQRFEYSADGGTTWVTVGDDIEIPFIGEGDDIGQYAEITLDLSGIEEINDNPDLHFRILSVGEGNDNPSGNQRIDNFTMDGEPILGSEASRLSILSVNDNEDVYSNEPFSILVQLEDEDGLPVLAETDITFAISVEIGTGLLTGNPTGTIVQGSSQTIVSDLVYDTPETGVTLKVTAEGLEDGLSAAFDVLLRTFPLNLVSNIPGAGELTGAGDYAEGEEVTINAVTNEGYEFINWTVDGEEIASTAEHTLTMPGEELTITANFEEIYTGGPMLIHYWHFNTMDGSEVTEVVADYSAGGMSATITYPGTGAGYLDARTHRPADPVSNFNLRLGQEPDQGAVLRVRNPANTRELLFEAPSTGFSDLVITWAATRSENGGTHQRFEYSVDGGTNWITFGDDIEIPFIGEGEEVGQYAEIVLDLSEIEEVNNNPDLHFRILSVGEGSDNTSGNQRIDNFTVDGIPLIASEPAMLSILSVNAGEDVFANEEFFIVVQVQDDEGVPVLVDADLHFSIAVESGTGILTVNPTGTIVEGTSFTTVSGLVYNVAEAGVSLRVDADDLIPGISQEFEVLTRTFPLHLLSNIPGAGELTGAGNYAEGEEVTITAVASEGYEFVNWTLDGNEFAADAQHSFLMPGEELTLTANFEEVYTGGPVLIHYWHFNTLSGTVEVVPSDFSTGGLAASITYPGTGEGYMDARTHNASNPVSNFNLRLGQEPDQGAVLRVRNPADTRELLFEIPSTGYSNLVATWAATRTENGGTHQRFEYSSDGGTTWVTVGDDIEIPFIGEGEEVGQYAEIELDLSGIQEINDNPDLHFRILAVGEGNDNPTGNQRIDNFTLDGTPILGGEPAVLSIINVNNGEDIYVNEAFSMIIQVLDDEGLPAVVEEEITITLSVETGTGNLGGTVTGVIGEGSTFVEITGITYDVAETGVQVKAEAEGLQTAVSSAIDVLERSFTVTLNANIPGAGELTGGGSYVVGEQVTIEAVANEGFNFEEWILDGDEFSSNPEHTFTMPDRDLLITAYFTEAFTGDPVLVHYWHFNTMTGETVTEVPSDYSASGLSATITYPGTGDGYMDARTHREADPVSNFNLRQGQEPDQGAVLRVRNPAVTRELLFEIPSTGYQNLVVTYATTRSENGGQFQRFEYSADGGSSWITVGADIEVPFIGELGVDEEVGVYAHVSLDLSEIAEVNDNPDLWFRILSIGEGNDNPSGNQRFDNFSVDGIPMDDVRVEEPISLNPGIRVSPNPTRGPVTIAVSEPGALIHIYNINGMLVMQQKVHQETLTIDTSQLNKGVYVVYAILPSSGKPVSVKLIVQ